ncbi:MULTISPECIES: helix-turn-helix domain-containing protein [Brenneria]|uniref:Helix-turn-helix domain-containing protein n=1 Tax=Brenneria nigrifluens DSM 30175 = ATCC 13028 TaxID=1121120 RepID=A0A2U1UUS7_9GAMM|nr:MULTISPECIES: helix-turn-helix domain-containing protein [Brenneria]EHD22099.1 helix-turn-helix domain protein [Brenneria sp. EniD312]PWC25429.1 transcriptional regulator [Brenneria nigrifluens DSM 30175 = ATCC 13028]QCR05179.1 helix-turn-helix domain-containing protein [Brenneria nigrifluens DSM 30175 = ATCC 13028]
MKNDALHERIKARRTELNMSQQKLADAVRVSHVTIFKWENGDTEPKGKNLFTLSKALRCSPTWLLYGDESSTPTPADELPTELDERQQKLLYLFDSLPESEKERHLSDLECKVDGFNALFEELLTARKKSKKK